MAPNKDYLTAFGRFTFSHPILGIVAMVALLPVYLVAGAIHGMGEVLVDWYEDLSEVRKGRRQNEIDLLLMTPDDEEWAESRGFKKEK